MSLLICLLGFAVSTGDSPSGSAFAQSGAGAGVLVDAGWLEQNLSSPAVRVLDLGRTREEFLRAHIPGAQFVDWRSEISDPGSPEYFNVLPADMMGSLLGRLGVSPETTVVLYDNRSSRVALRLFWVLRYYGHADVRILDGGLAAWESAGHGLTDDIVTMAATAYEVTRINEAYRADKALVQSSLAGARIKLIDARQRDFYTGASAGSMFGSERQNEKSGHIPGAQNFFWADHFNSDGTFKPAQELKARYEAAGVGTDGTVITYCHVGLQASTPWFVLKELLGYGDVRLYDASMAEWANADDTDVVTAGR